MSVKRHPWLGKKRSKETCAKISATLKKYKITDEHCANLSKARTGKKHSKETKRKIGESQIGKIIPEETRRKLAIANAGQQMTSEQKEKHYTNCPRGETHHFWNGGSSFELYPAEFNNRLKKSIRKRDNNRCICCDTDGEKLYDCNGKKYKLNVHHIDYDKSNNVNDNLISLCKNCHCRTNTNRPHWTTYFQGMIE